jgi:glycosyltransferase involved in cell wall biosynthesis
VERKDQATLLAAIADLPDLQLTLAGEGPEREALEALVAELGIAERVDFAGVVGQDDARRLYEAADLFCLSSRSEGLPAVLIEAMACALPVVATRIDAVPELINDGENGLLVEPGRPEELAAALGRLAADPALRQRLGTAARKTVSKRHDLGRQAAQLAELFGSSD